VRRFASLITLAVLMLSAAIEAQSPHPPKTTDLDTFMAKALQRRDIDKKTLNDYVLDEVEVFEALGPGRVPIARMRREYTWYVRDGFHVRSPLKVDGVPIPEDDRRAYEDRWLRSEQRRREFRLKRDEKREAEGKEPAVSAPSINEPRFVSESYFMDFKFEPGNYYLAGKETLDGQSVLKVDYLPAKLFSDDDERSEDAAGRESRKKEDEKKEGGKKEKEKTDPKREEREQRQRDKEKAFEQDIERKMNKSSQVSLWVDPTSHQIVRYTFDNVWLDFLPGAWLVRIDDLRASMQMTQPFPGVWLPRNVQIHAGATLALGSVEVQYTRDFSNYRKADVSTRVSVPKQEAR
jgi:hypothetical protein